MSIRLQKLLVHMLFLTSPTAFTFILLTVTDQEWGALAEKITSPPSPSFLEWLCSMSNGGDPVLCCLNKVSVSMSGACLSGAHVPLRLDCTIGFYKANLVRLLCMRPFGVVCGYVLYLNFV